MEKKTIRIEMEMPSAEAAEAKFPEARKTFSSGTSGLALRAARISPKIFLEDKTVVVELGFASEQFARTLLPIFEKQMKDAVAKEENEKGSCIDTKVFLKEEEEQK